MPRFNADNSTKIQPGRVLIVLKDPNVPDDVIRDIVAQQGEVVAMHRPESNQQLCFVQYTDPDTAIEAITQLRNYPLFKGVDPALKSERYHENNPNDQNQKKQQDYLLECPPQPPVFSLPLPHWDLLVFDRTYAFFSGVWNGVEIVLFYAAGQAVTILYPLPPYRNRFALASTLTAVAATRHSSAAFSMKLPQADSTITKTTKTDDLTSPSTMTPNKQFKQNRNDGRNNHNNNNNSNSDNFRRNEGEFNNRNGDQDSPPRHETQPEIHLGCWYCTSMPNFECRCGAFYCGIDCQRADWAKHKDICMPRLVPISYSNKLILQEAVASKNSSSISSTPYTPSSPESGGNKNNNHQQQRQQQKQQQQPQQQQQKQQFQRNNQQPNVQNRLAGGNGPRQNSQQQHQNGQDRAGSSNQVSEASIKLQRMKLNKSGSTSSPGRKQILEPGRFPPEGARVKITTSLPSGVLYIYHNNGQHGAQSDFQTLLNRLHVAAENESRLLQAAPKVDDVVFAPFQNMFYRAKVIAVKDAKIDVQFPDFGNLETVAWKESREITNEELKWAKYLSYPVMLEGVEGPLSKEQKQMVEQLEFEEEFELVKADTVPDSEVRQVVLKRERQNVTLNMALVELKEKELRQRRQREEQYAAKERLEKAEKEKKQEQTVKLADPNTYKPIIYDDVITLKQLTVDRRHKLCIIDASEVRDTQLISVIATDDATDYAVVVQDCERYGKADPSEYQPTVQGEVCLGRYKADWSRVLYDDEENSLLLDVGTMVKPDEFRRFPPGLSRTVYNNEVFVENMPLLEKIMEDGKPESILGKTIDAWVAASDNTQEGPLGIRIIPAVGN